MLQQISAALLTIIQLLLALFGFPAKGTPQPQTDTPCVFVHGLGGWGNYDTVNEVAPILGHDDRQLTSLPGIGRL